MVLRRVKIDSKLLDVAGLRRLDQYQSGVHYGWHQILALAPVAVPVLLARVDNLRAPGSGRTLPVSFLIHFPSRCCRAAVEAESNRYSI